MSIELRYFKNREIKYITSSLRKLLALNGKKLAELAKQNVEHNHAQALYGIPRFTKNKEKDNHPEGRVSIYCDKKYRHGREHGAFKCTVPVEFMRLLVVIVLDKTAFENDNLKHLSGVRYKFAIPLDEFFNWVMYENMASWFEDKVRKGRVNFSEKRKSKLDKQLEKTLIKELINEAEEKYLGGKKADSLPEALNYVKEFRLVFNI